MRHVAPIVRGDRLYIFFSGIGDAPERILLSTIVLSSDWSTWRASPPVEVLHPMAAYECTDIPGKTSMFECHLNGSYGVIASGSILGVGPVALIGVFNYDGAGNVNGIVIQKVNGSNVQVTFTGTYTVDENCLVSDTAQIPNGQTAVHAYVIVNDGSEFYILNTTPPTATSGNVIVGTGKKQFKKG